MNQSDPTTLKPLHIWLNATTVLKICISLFPNYRWDWFNLENNIYSAAFCFRRTTNSKDIQTFLIDSCPPAELMKYFQMDRFKCICLSGKHRGSTSVGSWIFPNTQGKLLRLDIPLHSGRPRVIWFPWATSRVSPSFGFDCSLYPVSYAPGKIGC